MLVADVKMYHSFTISIMLCFVPVGELTPSMGLLQHLLEELTTFLQGKDPPHMQSENTQYTVETVSFAPSDALPLICNVTYPSLT
jgi:hypothetical protein